MFALLKFLQTDSQISDNVVDQSLELSYSKKILMS